VENDPRYRAAGLLHSQDREQLFKEYIEFLDHKAKKREKEEISKREREKEIAKQKEKDQQELDRRRTKQKRSEEEMDFTALLSEKVKEPDMSWRDARKAMEPDGRWKTTQLLHDDKEAIFRDHVKTMYENRKKDFRMLLYETSEIVLSTDWKKAKDLLRADKRYERLYSERDRTAIFERYIREMQRGARDELRQLLKETKSINHNIPPQGPQMDKIKTVLQLDKRYSQWEEPERDKIIEEYVEELKAVQAKKSS